MFFSKRLKYLLTLLGVLAFMQTQSLCAQEMSPEKKAAMCQLGRHLLPNNPGYKKKCECKPSPTENCTLAAPDLDPRQVARTKHGVHIPSGNIPEPLANLLFASVNLIFVSDPREDICISVNYRKGIVTDEDAASFRKAMVAFINGNGGVPNNLHFREVGSNAALSGKGIEGTDNAAVVFTSGVCRRQ
ncbi:hypothetical protein [Azospirillum thermophilum]|uniref:hypothetical protein n=1 Tax=Azospirillum thermophilum TaxID=2202148 RepID=UPI0011B69603|nr:hypothetical protein [Azospirillum thermophilum]